MTAPKKAWPRKVAAKKADVVVAPIYDENTVHFCIASVPWRRESLGLTIASLLRQLPANGMIHVYLNGYGDVPGYLLYPSIEVIRSEDNGDYGDAGKFWWADKVQGYYLTGDDDNEYPPDYIARMVAGVEKHHHRLAAVGLHGDIFKTDIYRANLTRWETRKTIPYDIPLDEDLPVNNLGTGVTAFHTSTVHPSMSDFPVANMGDIWFACWCQRQRVPMIILAHQPDCIHGLPESNTVAIWTSIRNADGSARDTAAAQIKALQSIRPWRFFDVVDGRVVEVEGHMPGLKPVKRTRGALLLCPSLDDLRRIACT